MKRLLPLLFIALCLTACNNETIIANDAIDAKTRNIIKQKNDSIMLGLKTGSQRIFKNIATEYFMNNIQVQTKNLYRALRRLDGYKVYDQYEVSGKKAFDLVHIPNEKKRYTYSYTAGAATSFVCIMELEMGKDTGAVAAMYALVDNQWKLDRLDAFMLTADGKTAIELYEEGKKAEKAGNTYECVYYAANAAQMIETYKNTGFEPDNARKIILFKKNIENQLIDFPYTLENVPGKPVLTGIFTQPREGGKFHYAISYETKTPVSNLAALSKEYDLVKAEVKKVFSGINFDKSLYEFKALNIDAAEDRITDSYIFTY
ncbi:hypothetical protein AM493_09150 [Flavobacterium akiainvivens]|uniref:Lipoprotein n=1 Tax=Flavobacterium akiainvivens TaxID=1202724 RepID=A0A0M9VI25_9FLAO|nr:hypothetical protein [Flavobacterium akiainvivens]KOS06179.1 hypothetical protein AM493_09150 [Flavobacterium akiainvivens]SFQ68304.1 hypothetical protein SAMN05444144_11464 [Flavobacterium akiainvivens]